MMQHMSRDSLDNDRETLIFEHRGTVRVQGARVPSFFNRCGVEQRQWDHLARCWMAHIRYLPLLLERAGKERRNVVIVDHAESEAPIGNEA
jgi:hypothetical protein